jgi:hypothetical protein
MKLAHFLLMPFVEIEVRLGTISNKFDSSVDKKYFNQIKNSLKTCNWKTTETKNTIEHINKNIRHINQGPLLIMKENIIKKDIALASSPFDIRLSINQEFSLKSYLKSFSKIDCTIRKKDRVSFIDDNFRYDLTVVNETINNITKEKHEIEIELLVNKETLQWSNEYLVDFLECKIYDLVNIVEQTQRDKFKLF